MCVGFCAGDFAGRVLASALKTKLDVIEAGFDEGGKFRFVHGEAGSDEVAVQAGMAGSTNEIDDVCPREWLAAREIGLQDAGFGGFFEHARPDFGGEFVGSRLHFDWIGAVDTVKRAAVGEFRDESEWFEDARCHLQRKDACLKS
jgi:hypothetical protein